jgi:hypothetical protein
MKPPTYPSRRGGRRRPPRPSAYRILFSALFVLVFFSCVAAATTAANPTILKQNLIGNSGSESVPSIQALQNGGYILLGSTDSHPTGSTSNTDTDAMLVALDKDLNVLGAPKFLGDTDWDYGLCIQNTVKFPTKTEGFIIVGNSGSKSIRIDGMSANGKGKQDLWVVKLDSTGKAQWLKLLGEDDAQHGCSVRQTDDGGYLVLGSTNQAISPIDGKALGGGAVVGNDLWLLKLDANGNCEWQRKLGGNGNDKLGEDQKDRPDAESSLQLTENGGCIVIGDSTSTKGGGGDVNTDENHGNTDIWAVKLDATGTIIWERLLGGVGDESGMSVTRTHDGGYVILGSSYSKSITLPGINGDVTATSPTSGNDRDVWVVKLGGDGTVIWQTLLGGSGLDQGSSIVEALDGCYVLLGSSGSSMSGNVSGKNHGFTDIWVAKVFPGDGSIMWERLVGGSGKDYGHSLRSTGTGLDQRYIIAGTSESAPKGTTLPDGDVSVANQYTAGNAPTSDIWVVELRDRVFYYPVDRWAVLIRSWPLLQGLETLGSGTQTGKGAANGLARLRQPLTFFTLLPFSGDPGDLYM